MNGYSTALLQGGPADGLQMVVNGGPREITLTDGEYGTRVPATYVATGMGHSVGNDSTTWSYLFRLQSGELDQPAESDPAAIAEAREIAAKRADNLVDVWFADGPLGGTSGVWPGEHCIGPTLIDASDPSVSVEHIHYARNFSKQVRSGIEYDVYCYQPSDH